MQLIGELQVKVFIADLESFSFMEKYQYVYYRIYKWNLRTWGKSDVPEFNAVLGMSAAVFFNIFTIIILYNFVSGKYISLDWIEPSFVLIFAFSLVSLNYLMFMYKKRYELLEEKFGNELKAKKRRNGWIVVIYIVGSPTLPFLLMFLDMSLR